MKTASEILDGLRQFNNGTNEWHRYSPLFRNITLTDGTLWLAENAGAYWLMDAISSHQPRCLKDQMLRDMQFWTLKVNPDKSASLICERDSGNVAFTQELEFTDFPLLEIKLFVGPGPQNTMTICLPDEY